MKNKTIIRVKSGAKAGGLGSNHNETQRGLAVRTALRAGVIGPEY